MAVQTNSTDPTAEPAGWLQPPGAGQALATSEPRDWLVPDGDEWFRNIYTRVGVGDTETLAVCSVVAGEGKTTVSVGLAITIAQDYPERRVVLVETALAQPVLAGDFAVEPCPGLVDCLRHDEPIHLAVRPTYLPNLFLVPAGAVTPNPGRWLRSRELMIAMAELRRNFDVVILDLPALLASSHALPLTDLADGIVLVVRAGVTPTVLVNEAIGLLDDSRGRLRGVVLNGAQSSIPGWVRRLFGLWDH